MGEISETEQNQEIVEYNTIKDYCRENQDEHNERITGHTASGRVVRIAVKYIHLQVKTSRYIEE